jgi:hypothetical protein
VLEVALWSGAAESGRAVGMISCFGCCGSSFVTEQLACLRIAGQINLQIPWK